MYQSPLMGLVSAADGGGHGVFGRAMSMTSAKSLTGRTRGHAPTRGKRGHAEDNVVIKSQPSMMMMSDARVGIAFIHDGAGPLVP